MNCDFASVVHDASRSFNRIGIGSRITIQVCATQREHRRAVRTSLAANRNSLQYRYVKRFALTVGTYGKPMGACGLSPLIKS